MDLIVKSVPGMEGFLRHRDLPGFFRVDETINSRFVSEVWKLGLDMKDVCDRAVIEKAVRDVMVDRKEEFLKKANEKAKMARNAISEGGSSFCNLENLIEFIGSMIA
ncbi:hypothetical protein LguiA_034884 [Lonicera macranthoides]